MNRAVYIGHDSREEASFFVTRVSLLRHLSQPIPVRSLVLSDLQSGGLYTRPTYRRDGRMIDELSIRDDYDGSCATEHAIGRFFVPHLAKSGWALFMDGDMLVRADLAQLFKMLDPKFAVYCVKHDHVAASDVKMDAQVQTNYPRKNWSSLMVFNCDHPANDPLTLEWANSLDLANSLPGRDLHRFCWLDDNDIGELDPSWNYLVGCSPKIESPNVIHFTLGLPNMGGYHDCEFADEWRAELIKMGEMNAC